MDVLLRWVHVTFLTCQSEYRPVKYCWLHFVVKVKPKAVS